jgi:hypothetical protein
MNQSSGEQQTLEIVPDPVSLMESMRAVGYTVDAAVADLIDNSISAGATSIDVEYDPHEEPFVAILDNGKGMSGDALESAMRHGSRNPAEDRAPDDLGRFGLGLKTASLSQCRRLTVVSRTNSMTSALSWDLDVVRKKRRWLAVIPTIDEVEKLPLYDRLARQSSGTLVIWQNLDRLVAGASNPVGEMTTKLSGLRDHLALVFHRFTAREDGNPTVAMRINQLALPARDPFLRSNSFRQAMEGQTLRHARGTVSIQPCVLPPISRLSSEEVELAGGREGLRGTQGFYIYRNRRLVIWGTWFRLVPKHEFFKLTRVQVDIPNSFDDLWSLDIKKSAAQPPDFIRNRLRELIPHFANASKRTVTYPGRRSSQAAFTPLWNRIEPEHKHFKYEVNSEHSAIQAFASDLDEPRRRRFASVLELISASLPLQAIYADMGQDVLDQSRDLDRLADLVRKLHDLTGLTYAQVVQIDPIARHPDLHKEIVKKAEEL